MDNSKRIIVFFVSNREWGGGEQYVFDLCHELRIHGERLLVVCRCKEIASVFQSANFSVMMLPLKGFVDGYSPLALWRKLKKEGHIILHVHNFKDAFVAAGFKRICPRAKVVMTRHLVRTSKDNAIYRFIYNKIDRLIFVSQLAQDAFNSTPNSLDSARQCVVINGVKQNPEIEGEIPACLTGDLPVVMYHGRLAPEKGVHVLLQAATRVPIPFQLVLIGGGSDEYMQELHSIVEKGNIGDKVTFLGFRKDASALAAYADIAVLPTTGVEACGLSNIEYMSHGKAQIATNNGAQKEYLTNGETAFLVNPDDENALAEKMTYLLSHHEHCASMGAKAIKYFNENLRYDLFFNKIQTIYNTL